MMPTFNPCNVCRHRDSCLDGCILKVYSYSNCTNRSCFLNREDGCLSLDDKCGASTEYKEEEVEE